MGRNYTMRKYCLECGSGFTLEGSAQKFCKNGDCISRRRKQRYAELKPHRDRIAERKRQQSIPAGSDAHLERAIKSGE